jgi:hypothetical protein
MDLTTLLVTTTISTVKSFWDAAAYSAGLPTTTWIKGLASWAMRETVTQLIFRYVAAQDPIIRAQWLALATDPGDVDPYNPANATLAPAPGFLSAIGENVYGTTRITATFASGTMSITNNSGAPLVVSPQSLTFQNTVAASDGSYATYRNDVGSYVVGGVPTTLAAGGSFTLANGATATGPATADVAGTISNAASTGTVTTLQNGLPGVTVTNTTAILGSDRESAAAYRERCAQQGDATSPSGPAQAFDYLSNHLPPQLGGGPLLNANGVPVGITRSQVTTSSTNGTVDQWFASATGAADAVYDIPAAIANVQKWAVPIGWTYSGHNATETSINITATAELPSSLGVTALSAQGTIAGAIDAYFGVVPVGGWDQVAGAGFVYTGDIVVTIGSAIVGLRKVAVTVPSGASTAIAQGHVPKRGTTSITVTLV